MKITKEKIKKWSLNLFTLSSLGLLGFQVYEMFDSLEYELLQEYYVGMKQCLPSEVGNIPIISMFSLEEDRETGNYNKYNEAFMNAAMKQSAGITEYSLSHGIALGCGDSDVSWFGDPNRFAVSLTLNRKGNLSKGELYFESRLEEIDSLYMPLYMEHGDSQDIIYIKINNIWYKTTIKEKLDSFHSPQDVLLENSDIKFSHAPSFFTGTTLFAFVDDFDEGAFAFVSSPCCRDSRASDEKLIIQLDSDNQLSNIACNSTDFPVDVSAVSQHLSQHGDFILEYLFNNYQIRTIDVRTKYYYDAVDDIVIPDEALKAANIDTQNSKIIEDHLIQYITKYADVAGFDKKWGEYDG